MRSTRPRGTGLVAELRRSQRLTMLVLLSVLLLTMATSGYLIVVSQPRLTATGALNRDVRDLSEGMLAQDAALQSWLTTADASYLTSFDADRARTSAAARKLVSETQDNPTGTPEVVETLLGRVRWESWATWVATLRHDATGAARPPTGSALTAAVRQGSDLFADYHASADRSTTAVRAARLNAEDEQALVLRVVFGSYVVLLAGAALVAVRRQRRARRQVLDPLEDLHTTIVAIRSGELSARARPTDVPELAEMGAALERLATELQTATTDAAARERRLARLAYRFETVVRVGREIAGSLSVHYVSATVTTAAAELLNAPAVLWLRGDQQTFEAVHRSRDPHGVNPPVDLVPPTIVARAAADAHIASELGRSAYPLVLAGRVTAVLEVATTQVDADIDQVLSALLSTAAASLESAHLHSTAREMADLDGLTQLPNRRRFETDADTEWERCRRYKRPLSLIMIDLDHFKQLNDDFGHPLGDEVLREVARTLRDGLRTTDTAYRYGGEEIVVLLRETRLEEASAVAERLRGAIAGLRLPSRPEIRVTASAGVTTRRTSMTEHTELVAEADRALYDAKRAGRDRVVTARVPGETLVHGDAEGPLLPGQVVPR